MEFRDDPPFVDYFATGDGRSDEEVVYGLLSKPPAIRLGQIAIGRFAGELMDAAGQDPRYLLTRHAMADFGILPPKEREQMLQAMEGGLQVCSRYRLQTGKSIWILTSPDRTVTAMCRRGEEDILEYLLSVPPRPKPELADSHGVD